MCEKCNFVFSYWLYSSAASALCYFSGFTQNKNLLLIPCQSSIGYPKNLTAKHSLQNNTTHFIPATMSAPVPF
ncbi:MAG: hypothetical protein PUE88_08665 [Ruminococcus sp.]|nr:hypothetical protein [Ruminococcus sp.]MDD6586779.1 hypothetical protein [Ruminococcus sp.]